MADEKKPKKVSAKAAAPKADPAEKAEVVEKAPKADKPAKVEKASAAKPQTMEELLANNKYTLMVPKKGSTVTGLVTDKQKKALVIDIGAKTEGVVSDKEFEVAAEYIEQLKAGDTIEAIVISTENDRGQVLLSLKQAAQDAKWDYFTKVMESNEILDAKGVEVNKGGLIVVVNGVRGFVPSSQFGKQFMGNINRLRGESLKVRAIEVDREKNRLIFSERHVSEEKELAQRSQALQSVKSGEIYEGVVSGVMHFGLFVTVEIPVEGSETVGHVEGLVHISEISWEKVNNPKDYHKVGDRVKVRVLGIDEHTGKLNLSLKQLSDDPWKGIAERYSAGTTFTGTVSRIEPFGVFVHVEAGVDGLIHSSKLNPGTQLTKGEEVTVTVESVDPDQRRMSLSMVLTELPVGYK
jgi:small subunit ribosomal protein S1